MDLDNVCNPQTYYCEVFTISVKQSNLPLTYSDDLYDMTA